MDVDAARRPVPHTSTTVGAPVPRRTGAGYLISFALAVAVSLVLSGVGLVDTPLLVAIALASTSLGVLIPVLKDAGAYDSALGQLEPADPGRAMSRSR